MNKLPRRAGWLLIVGCLLASVTACGAAGQPAVAATAGASNAGASIAVIPLGSSAQSIVVDGVTRTFRVYRPSVLPRLAPLVVMLHGGYGSAAQAERAYGWDKEADTGHFLVAYPDGLHHAWNVGGGCCGEPATAGVNDVAFITKMVAAIGQRIPLDSRRLYATGISNGGMMAYRLACDTGIFAAIGPDSATLLGTCPSPAPVSVIHIHGTADRTIPYNGGQGNGPAHIDGPSVPAVIAQWSGTDHCADPVITRHPPVTTSIATCPGGRAVELITIQGAGHQWPGSPSRPLLEHLLGTDPPSTALNATATIWAFFLGHPKAG